MKHYTRLSLTLLMLVTSSMNAMEQKDLLVTKALTELTIIDPTKKPEPLLTLCIKHFGRARAMCNADGNTLGHLLSPESIIPENLAIDIIKKFPNNVIKECAQEIAEKLSTALPAKMNIAFIDKLAECHAIVPCRTMLQRLINDPKTSKEIKQRINHLDPLFQSMKAFLMQQVYAKILPEYRKIIEQQQIENTALSPDGKYNAVISNDIAQILTIDGQCIATLTDHTDWIWSISWSPDGKYLATGSRDKTGKIWDLHGECIATLSGHADDLYSISWSPDGKYLATGSHDKTVKIWTIDGQCIATLKNDHIGWIELVSWSPDGKYLMSYFLDKTTRKWDIHLLNTITQHSFSYDEILLIQATADAQKSGLTYPLNQQEQQIFNQLCNADPELHNALYGALDPLVKKNELSTEEVD